MHVTINELITSISKAPYVSVNT